MENIISVSHLSFGYDSKRKGFGKYKFSIKKRVSRWVWLALTALESLLF